MNEDIKAVEHANNDLLGLKYIRDSEIKTALETRNRLKGVLENFPWIIDLLFKLPYFIGEQGNPEDEDESFKSFSRLTYMQVSYTFLSIYDLYEKGYYLEALILYRNIFESYVQLRYFYKYPEKAHGHIISETRRSRVLFIDMINEFSEGLYSTFYGMLLSGVAHGGIIKDIFRVKTISRTERCTVMGCEYIEDHATLIANITVPLLFGYINMFEQFLSYIV